MFYQVCHKLIDLYCSLIFFTFTWCEYTLIFVPEMVRVDWKDRTAEYLPPAYVRTTGGYIFTGVCLFNFWGGRGYPIPGLGRRGVPHLRSWWGGTPSQVWPGGYPLQTDQHSEHLLRGGQYASCVHAGGLSCSCCSFKRRFRQIEETELQIISCYGFRSRVG